MAETRLPGLYVKSGSIPTTALSGGVVSSSQQIIQSLPVGTVSSSTQVTATLPNGVVSSSAQYPGWVTASSQIQLTGISGTSFAPLDYTFTSNVNIVNNLTVGDSVDDKINVTGSINVFGGMISGNLALPVNTVSSSTQVKTFLPNGSVSSSDQYPGWVTASSQIDYNSIQNKLSGVVSASSQIKPLLPNGSVSASDQYPGWVTASSQIDYNLIQNKLSGTVSSSTQIQPLLPTGTVSSSTQYPGWVTASTQIDYNSIQNKLSGVLSSSTQIKPLLPEGTVTSSTQYPGWVTASSQIDYNSIQNKLSGVVSSSTQIQPLLPDGTVSASNQIDYNSIQNKLSNVVSSSTQVKPLLPDGTVTSSAQYPGWVTASSQIDYNSIQNKLSGTVSSSSQVKPLLPEGTVSSSSQVKPLLPEGTVTSSAQYPGWVSSSSQIDYNNIQNKLNGVVSSSTQVKPLLPEGTVSSSTQYPGWVTASSQVDITSTTGYSTFSSSIATKNDTQDISINALNVATSSYALQTQLSGVASSSTQIKTYLPIGTVSSSVQYPGWVTASSQVQLNQITGVTFGNSDFTFPQNLTVAGTLTAQQFNTEYVSSSIIYESGSTKFGDTADDIHQFTGSVLVQGKLDASGYSVKAQSFTGSFSGSLSVADSASYVTYANVDGKPTLVSSSTQIDYNNIQNKLSGVVSSSAQIQPLLPVGTVSSSTQATTWTVLSSSYAATASYVPGAASDWNTLANKPIDLVSSSIQVKTFLPTGTVSSSAQYPGWVTASSQIDYNSITNKLSGVVSSSTQVQPLLPNGTVSSSTQVDVRNTTGITTIATTGSNTFVGNQIISGSLTTTADTMNFNGSMAVSGTLGVTGSITVINGGMTGSFSGSHTGTFPYASLTGIPSGIVSSSTQIKPLLPDGTITSSAQYPGWVTSSAQINTGSFSGSITTASYVIPSGLPTGTVSASSQIDYNNIQNKLSGVVSSSTQVQPLLPGGTVSASAQYPGWVTASSQIDYNNIQNKLSGVVSSSTQIQPLLPNGTVSSSAQYPGLVTSSTQIDYNSVQNKLSGVVSSSTQVKPLLPDGTVSASVQYPGWVTASSQIDYNSIQNKLSGVYSSSTQTVASIVGQTITPSNINATGVISGSSIQVSGNGTVGGNFTIIGTLTVASQSISYVSSSQLNIATNKITINTDNALRFGGISVIDSGSVNTSGSLYWDSVGDRWIYEDVTGGTYTSAILIAGPKNIGALGNERGLLSGRIPVASGDDHIDTAAASSSLRVDFPSRLTHIESGLFITGALTANGVVTLQGIPSSSAQITILLPADIVSSSTQVKTFLPNGTVSSSAQYPGWVTASSQIDYNSIQNKLSGVVSSSAQVQPLLPIGTVSSSAQYPGWVTASSQIDYNSIQNKLSGVISSSTQFNALAGTSASFAFTSSFLNTLNQNVSASGNIVAGANLISNFSVNDEGGEINLARPQTNSSISGSVVIDVNQNRVRIFESNSPNRGGYFDITSLASGVGTNLATGGTITSIVAGNGLTGGTITSTGTITVDTGSTHFSSGVIKILPIGTVSSSAQIDYNSIQNKLSGVVSSSTQVKPLLPDGTVSSSTQQVVSTYTNATDNRVLTSTGAGGINGESALTFDGAVLAVTTNNAKFFQGGDDSALYDVNIANTLGIHGQQDSTVGAIKLGSSGQTIYSNATGVGIGTTSPAALLHVQGNVSGATFIGSFTGSHTGTFPYASLTGIPSGIVSSSTQVATLLPASTVSSSTASSPSQGTVRVTINGVNTDVDTGLQTGDSPTFSGLTSTGTVLLAGIYSSSGQVTISSTTGYSTFSSSIATKNDLQDVSINALNAATSSYAINSTIQTQLAGVVSSSTQVKPLLPSGTVTSSAQYPGWVTASGQVLLNAITGTTFSNSAFYFPSDLRVEGNLTAQQIYTEFVSSSVIYESGSTKFGDTNDDIMSVTGSIRVLGGNISGSFIGLVSQSSQIDYNSIQNKLSGVVSSSAQVQPLLPNGTVSASAQYPGWVTASSQIDYNSIQNKLSGVVSSSAQVQPLLPNGTVSSSAQYPGWVTASSQIDYNSIQNKLSGVVSSSTQVATLLPASTVSSSTASSPSQGTVRVTINGVNTDVDTGLQTGDSPTFSGLTSTGTVLLAGIYSSSAQTITAIANQTIAPTTVNATTINASVVTASALTANQAVFTNASDGLVSNAITGTGNVVMSAGPTLTGTITAQNITATGTMLLAGIYSSSAQVDYNSIQNKLSGVVSSSTQVATLLPASTVSSSTASSPSQGTVRVTINGANTDVDTGLQTGDSPSFVTITSTQATGTAPLTVASTTAVTNLNADLLDGNHASAFYLATNPSGYTTNTGTVTSVGGTGTVSGLTLTGTVTTTGNLTLGGTLSVAASNFSSQTANTFLAAPNGSAGTPTFRAIVAADVPTLNQNTTGTASNITAYTINQNVGTGNSPSFAGLAVDTSTLYVDATNDRVGIGTTSPNATLVVYGGEGTYDAPTFGPSSRGAIQIRSVTSNRRNAITFSSNNTDDAQAGIYVHQDSGNGTHMYLATTDSYVTGPQARVTIRNTGNVGIGTITPNRTLSVNGSTNITGSLDVTGAFTAQTKSFKIQHQTIPGKSLVYGVLEGPEHGVYVRGRLTNNNTIILPAEWDWLIDSSSITVQLTPIGSHQKLYVDDIVNNVIFIKNENLINKDIDCFYIVHATRKDVDPLQTVQ